MARPLIYEKVVHHAKRFLIVLLLAIPAFAQKDFLTDSEIEQVREVQEPVARIKLYLLFAKQRLDQVQSLMAKDRPGRSGEIRQLLEDYTSIVDAIDTVSDDALVRKNDVTTAPTVIADGEKKFLDQLQKIQTSTPHDLAMYDFALKEALSATGDSLDLTKEDLTTRGQNINLKVEEEKKKVATVNAEERQGAKDPQADKAEAAAEDAATPARQAPTLYRPGEKPDDTK
jgi:hypothetical protein